MTADSLNSIRSRIESLGMDFQFVKTVKTGANGAERETWLLEYEGSRFIFVSGRKNVTLGWDTDKCPLGDGVLEGLQEEFSSGHEYYYEEELEDLKGDYQDAPSAAVTGQSMSCPVILPFIGSPRTSAIWACRKTIFAIGVSSGCRNRFDLADESCRPDEMARTGK